MKRVFLSLLIGLCISAVPAQGALISQSGHHDFKRPEPLIYEADPKDFTTIEFEEIKGSPAPEAKSSYVVNDGIPSEIKEAAEYYGEQFGICPELIEAIAEHESEFSLAAVNDSDIEHSVGIMQVNLKCSAHQDRLKKYNLTETDMSDIDNSVLIACDILKELFDTYEDVGEVLIRYNGDKTGLKEFKRSGELTTYASEILERAEELEVLHGKK